MTLVKKPKKKRPNGKLAEKALRLAKLNNTREWKKQTNKKAAIKLRDQEKKLKA